MREDVVGRANVEDTPELDRYYQELGRQESYALWTVANSIEPWQPQPASQAAALELQGDAPAGAAGARPGQPREGRPARHRAGKSRPQGHLGLRRLALQRVAGDEARRVRDRALHASSALRFVMEGKGAYTVVDGHKMDLGAGDFVITPNGTWHDHGVEADGATTIWQDGLDMLLVNQLDANFYAVHPDRVQKSNYPLNDTAQVYGGPGLDAGRRRSLEQAVLAAAQVRMGPHLRDAGECREGDRWLALRRHHDAIRQSGDRRPGDEDARRAYPVAARRASAPRRIATPARSSTPAPRAAAHSIIAGKRYDWSKNDIFVVPSWACHEHANASERDDAVLFSFSDLPSMVALGLYREENLTDNDGHQKLAH